MAKKKTRRELEFEAWLRRLQSALVNVEGAASLWGGCIAEAEDRDDIGPEDRFVQAMNSEDIEQRLWLLAHDMQVAIAKGDEAMTKPKKEEENNG